MHSLHCVHEDVRVHVLVRMDATLYGMYMGTHVSVSYVHTYTLVRDVHDVCVGRGPLFNSFNVLFFALNPLRRVSVLLVVCVRSGHPRKHWYLGGRDFTNSLTGA